MESQWDKPVGFDQAQIEQKAGLTKSEYRGDEESLNTESEEILRDAKRKTILFGYLQQRKWAEAFKRVRYHPEEAKMWVNSGLCPSLPTKWKVLPLHAAIILGAPVGFICELLDSYPNAVTEKDLKGSLPIHLSALALSTYHSSEQVFVILLSAYGESRYAKDGDGRTPTDLLQRASLGDDKEAGQRRERILEILSKEPQDEEADTLTSEWPLHISGVRSSSTVSTMTMKCVSHSPATSQKSSSRGISGRDVENMNNHLQATTTVTKETKRELLSHTDISLHTTIASVATSPVPDYLECHKGSQGTVSDMYHSSGTENSSMTTGESPSIGKPSRENHSVNCYSQPSKGSVSNGSEMVDVDVLEKIPSELVSAEVLSSCGMQDSIEPASNMPSFDSAKPKGITYFKSKFSVDKLKSDPLSLIKSNPADAGDGGIVHSFKMKTPC